MKNTTTEVKNYTELLRERFDKNDIEWRIQQSGFSNGKPWIMAVPFVQARAIQERLDDVFGFENWEDTYRKENNSWICTLRVNVNGKMVTKENGADETQIEPTKGGISDSFKRVASSGYGIGRYLYKETLQFADCSTEKKQGYTQKSKVKNNGKSVIVYWKIPNLSSDGIAVTSSQIKRLCTLQTKAGVNEEDIKKYINKEFNIKSRKQLNRLQYEKVCKALESKIKKEAS